MIQAVIARRHDIGTGQLYTWRKQLLRGAMAGFVPVEFAKAEVARKPRGGGKIAIVSGSGFTVCVDGLVDRAAPKLVLDVVWQIAPVGPSLPPSAKIYLSLAPCDMRKGFDGLAAQVRNILLLDPFSGAVFLFQGKRATG